MSNEYGNTYCFRRRMKYGYCCFEIEQGENPIIFNLYIYPSYRRQGYGRKILQRIINDIRKTGYAGEIDIVASPLEDSISREKLISFYSTMGLNILNKEENE